MDPITDLPGRFPAGASLVYSCTLTDSDGQGIPASDLTSLTLTLALRGSGEIINNIERSNILNTGRGVVDAEGNLTVTLLPEDTAFVGATLCALPTALSMVIDWSFNAGLVSGRQQINFTVVPLTETVA